MSGAMTGVVTVRCQTRDCKTILGVWDGEFIVVDYTVRSRYDRVHLRFPGGFVTIRCRRCNRDNDFHTDSLSPS